MKKCLILGVTGQDGSYMAELLLSKKYKVFGLIRKSATGNTKNIEHLINNPKIYNKNFEDMKKRSPDLKKLKKLINYVPNKSIEKIIMEIIN